MLISWLPSYEEDTGTPAGGTGETPTTPPPAPEGETPTDDFDKERAMATIRKQREELRTASAKLKRLEELEAKEQERTDKELSEAQKLRKQLDELTAQHTEAQAKIKRSTLLEAARAAASKAGLSFHDGALSDALQLGTFDGLEWNDKGEPLGVGDAVKTLAKERPYLLKPATQASADLDGARRGKADQKEEEADRLTRLARQWGFRNIG